LTSPGKSSEKKKEGLGEGGTAMTDVGEEKKNLPGCMNWGGGNRKGRTCQTHLTAKTNKKTAPQWSYRGGAKKKKSAFATDWPCGLAAEVFNWVVVWLQGEKKTRKSPLGPNRKEKKRVECYWEVEGERKLLVGKNRVYQ